MSVHDWTRVDAGLFHDFHQSWTVEIRNALNDGALPADFFALVEQNVRGPIADVLTLRLSRGDASPLEGGIAVATAPPQTHLMRRNEANSYAELANRVTVRHRHGDVVAVIEVLSPGNKASRAEFKAFIDKSVSLLRQRVHLLLIDLFPPTKRDPQGVHKAIWDEFCEEDFDLPPGRTRILASYDAGPPQVAYVEPVGVGDVLPGMPLFLSPERYVPTPLESSYQTAWSKFPTPLKGLLE